MPYQLKSHTHSPPGNYYYVQSECVPHTFRPNPVIDDVAKAVSAFRTANRLPRASLGESLEDVDRFTCARLGNHPSWCWNCPDSFEATHQSHRFIKPPCVGCGHLVPQ